MIKVLVHYKQYIDSSNVHFDGTLEDRSEIVEVKDVLELNSLFKHITKIDLINNSTVPVVVGQIEQLKMLEYIRHLKDVPLDVQNTIDKMYLSYL